jgi:pimeloyl-ACP methyl ester carboxylesterase
MKYIKYFLWFGFSFLVMASCVNNQDTSEAIDQQEKQPAEIEGSAKSEISGQDKILDADDNKTSEKQMPETIKPEKSKPTSPASRYAIYQPEGPHGASGWPLVIFLDPHGNGGLPVSLYQGLANKYGFLLIGSNEFKNGIPGSEVIKYFDELLSKAKNDFSIDEGRIYLMGFSGGARVGLAFAEAYPEINALVACGAGIQAGVKAPKPTFSYLGMAGKDDFNMIEVINTDRSLKRQGFNRALIIFDGDHSWPPTLVAREAFQWLNIIAMKEKSMAVDQAEIRTTKDWYLKKINSMKEAGNIFDSYEVAERAISVLNDLADVSNLRVLADDLRKNPVYKEQLSEMVGTMQMEMGMQNNYMQAFAEKDIEWWGTEITKLNDDGVAQSEQHMKKRLLAYLGIVAYMMSDRAVNEKDIQGSEKYLEIYRLLEPANPEHSYLEAKRRMMMGEQNRALDYLRLAVIFGFDNKDRLFNDPAFGPLHNNPEFIGLME